MRSCSLHVILNRDWERSLPNQSVCTENPFASWWGLWELVLINGSMLKWETPIYRSRKLKACVLSLCTSSHSSPLTRVVHPPPPHQTVRCITNSNSYFAVPLRFWIYVLLQQSLANPDLHPPTRASKGCLSRLILYHSPLVALTHWQVHF